MISLFIARTRLNRHGDTVRDWCRRLDIRIVNECISSDDYHRLDEYDSSRRRRTKYCVRDRCQPAGKAPRTRSIVISDREVARRIAAASRFKVRTGGMEVQESQIEAEMQ